MKFLNPKRLLFVSALLWSLVLFAVELRPVDKVDVASGAARDTTLWYPGGIGGNWLAVGQPNLCNRHDKVVFRFSLENIKTNVARAVLRYRQTADKRNADEEELIVEHFTEEPAQWTVALLNEKNVKAAGSYRVQAGTSVETVLDVTEFIREDLRKGFQKSTFRVASLVAEKSGAPRNKLVNCVSLEKTSIVLELIDEEALSKVGQVLSPGGNAYQAIEVDPSASALACYAARELQEHLHKITGNRLPILSPGASGKLPVIAIGRHAAKKRMDLDLSDLPEEGFKIVSTSDVLVISGNDHEGEPLVLDKLEKQLSVFSFTTRTTANHALGLYLFGDAGSLYGVYHLLERFAGVRWYMPGPDGCVIPENKKLQIPEITHLESPYVNYRYIQGNMLNTDIMQWVRRIRGGGNVPVTIGHSFDYILRLKDTHPDIFAIDPAGNRDFTNKHTIEGHGHLCLTNPKTADVFAEEVIQFFRNNPDLKIFSVMPGDGLFAICHCPNCQAEIIKDLPHGRFSRHVWGFVNKVAKKVAKVFPDKLIGCCAYEDYLNPPDDLVLETNVAVMICYHRYNMHNPAYAKKIHKIIDSWTAKSKHVYTWNYYLSWVTTFDGLLDGSPRQYQADYKRLVSSGNWKGEFVEAGYHGKMLDLATRHLLIYISARTMWDPKTDVDEILNEYYRLFYGPAEKQMRTYFETAFESYEQKVTSSRNDNPPAPEFIYPPAVITTMENALKEAQKSVPADSVYRRRIDMVAKAYLPAAEKLKGFIRLGNPKITAEKISSGDMIVKAVPSSFVGINGETPEHRTWVSAGYDAENIYFRFYCFEDQMDQLKADYTGPGDSTKMWSDDTIEIFICPDISKPEILFQFAVTPNGKIWDAKVKIGAAVTGIWNSRDLKFKITRESNRWIVDMSIPFAELGITPAPEKQMKVNFIRNRMTGGKGMRSSCFGPLFAPDNFMPERYGTLTFGK